MSGLNDMVTKFEDSMAKYNINTTACMQKALCTYVQSAGQVKEKSGINGFVDSTVNVLTKYGRKFPFLFPLSFFNDFGNLQ